MDHIVFREAETDDAEEMISYLNIVGRESDHLMHGSDGFKAPVEAVKRRIQASHDADNSMILIALAGEKIIARAEEIRKLNQYQFNHRVKATAGP